MLTHESSIGVCVKIQEDMTVIGQLVSKYCLDLYAHLMTQHIGANTESTADGVVR